MSPFKYTGKPMFKLSSIRFNLISLVLIFMFCIWPRLSTAETQKNECTNKINQLGSDLKNILTKIPVMPPLTDIYIPLRKLFNEAVAGRDAGDYGGCVEKANLALKYSKV